MAEAPTGTISRSRGVTNNKNGSQMAKSKALKLKKPERSICVYCGSGSGRSPAYAEAANALGRELAEHGIGLVYGGGSLGLMGEVARAVIDHGGYVTGIIPTFLSEKEKMLESGAELIVVDDMHQRKMLMFERSDAFVALPGGVGTLEELVEQLTWSQLGQHAKPIVVCNIKGFWSPFLALLEHMRAETFVRPGLELEFLIADDATEIVPLIQAQWKETDPDAREAEVVAKF